MDLLLPVFVSGSVSVIGVFLSVILTRHLTNRANIRQSKIQTTLEMYRHFQSITTHGICADKILRRQLLPDEEKDYMGLSECMSSDEWQHISITRHFFTELSLLHYAKKIDTDLAKELFSSNFKYWHNRYFSRLRVYPYGIKGGTGIHVASGDIANWLA